MSTFIPGKQQVIMHTLRLLRIAARIGIGAKVAEVWEYWDHHGNTTYWVLWTISSINFLQIGGFKPVFSSDEIFY